ncbi:hypothetical protein BX600DRAFT_475428 [Xylariales sp. PMI_506]|nr:hypothetical protein BX600DRAFT_475428 [Xylariales sp. PMI_506]
MAPLVWLVTATTSGLGASVVEAIVARGDKVIATGRNAEQRLAHLKSDNVRVLDLDVTSGPASIKTQVEKAWGIFGRIDVLLNNAGVSAPKSIEEADDAFVQKVFAVNVFGTLHVTQAILPYFRKQQSGTIAFTGAGLAWAPLPFLAHYAASKAALDIFVEGLAKETSSFGIRCVIFEPGGFASNLGQAREGFDEGFDKFQPSIPDYEPLYAKTMNLFATEIGPSIAGDIKKLSEAIVDVIRSEGRAQGSQWALRVLLGSDALAVVRQKCTEQLQLAKNGEAISLSTDRDGHNHEASKGMLEFMSITH